jgi:hypothetical protein
MVFFVFLVIRGLAGKCIILLPFIIAALIAFAGGSVPPAGSGFGLAISKLGGN